MTWIHGLKLSEYPKRSRSEQVKSTWNRPNVWEAGRECTQCTPHDFWNDLPNIDFKSIRPIGLYEDIPSTFRGTFQWTPDTFLFNILKLLQLSAIIGKKENFKNSRVHHHCNTQHGNRRVSYRFPQVLPVQAASFCLPAARGCRQTWPPGAQHHPQATVNSYCEAVNMEWTHIKSYILNQFNTL